MSMIIREDDVDVAEIVAACEKRHVEKAMQKISEAVNALSGTMGGDLSAKHEVRRALTLVEYALQDALDEME